MVAPLALAAHVAVPLVGGFVGSLATGNAVKTWYPKVWSTLYVTMGTASYLISRAGGSLVLYGSQLVLNFTWTPTFFGAKRLKLALANISALDATLLATTVQFFRQSSVAGALMVPYCAWSVLATALNTRIMLDNPEQSQDTNNPPWDQSKTTASKAQ